MKLSNILRKIGFSKKESEILEYLYEKGKSKASQISRELNIPKSTALFVLYRLEDKNFIFKRKEGRAYIFEPNDPTNLLKHLETRIKREKMKRQKLLPLIPEIRRLKDLKPDNKIHFYEKSSSIKDLKHSISERLDNKDIEKIYSNKEKRVYHNEDFTFLITKDIAIRFDDIETLKKFISACKDIDEKRIKS